MASPFHGKKSQPASSDLSNTIAQPTTSWAGINIPKGFSLQNSGTWQIIGEREFRIAGPVWIDALTRDSQSGNWGLSVCWLDHDGHLHNRAIPKQRLHESGTVLAQELAGDGLDIIPGKERLLNRYLAAFEPTIRLRSVTRLGWVDQIDDLIFVLPNQILGRQIAEAITFQPERYSPSAHTIHPEGSVETWRLEIAKRCAGNPILVFSLCAAFAAPLLEPAHMDGGGFHVHGASSRGKTTALQIATSVWGCGADPAEASARSAIRRWNSTRNGLEGLAAASNDILLALDELGSLDADDFGRIIYDLAGGQGKVAMNVNRTLREQHAWRNLILSTGEISGQEKIQQGRRQGKAGQQLRFMDIPITQGVISETQGIEPAAFANQLKRACGKYYGTAGPSFIDAIIHRFSNREELRRYITTRVDTECLTLARGISLPEQRRAVRKLSLVLVAGEMAREFAIVPDTLDVRQAIQTVRDAWLNDVANRPASVLGARAVQSYILRRRENFRDSHAINCVPLGAREIAGYYNTQSDLYFFTDEVFADACGGHNPQSVAGELASRGLLHMNDRRYKSKQMIRQDGVTHRIRFYTVKGAILDADLD